MEEETSSLIRYGITASFAVATYIALTCPCRKPFLSCHLPEIFVAGGMPLILIAYINMSKS